MSADSASDYLSVYTHPIDRKGRVSIPSAFRRVLATEDRRQLLCCPSPDGQAIDAGGTALQRHLHQMIAQHSGNWVDRDSLETMLLGFSHTLKIDSDGRVLLPDVLIQRAEISQQVTFVGKGYRFQMWSPARFENHFNAAQARALRLWQSAVSPE